MSNKEIIEAYQEIIKAQSSINDSLSAIIESQNNLIMQFMGVQTVPPVKLRANR